jgi:DNA-binding SARP family transcriptional activator
VARLIEQHRIVCVYASPGAGKTTAVLQAVQRLGRPLAWLSVDATDLATGRLLTYLAAALATQRPDAVEVVRSALAGHLPHTEVAGLLAEAAGDSPLLVVLDDLERFGDDPAALAVIASFARYIPPSARLVMVSRAPLSFRATGAAPFPAWIAAVGEQDLAFTVQEAADALTVAGKPDVDPLEAIVETGGWVTGVLFEAWRSADHIIGIGGEADPLHGYLATQILDQLEPSERNFLIRTAVLEEVAAGPAHALGIPNASARLHALRECLLPVSWDRDGKTMRCHPRFREYLLELLARRGDDELHRLRYASAGLLAAQGHDEEAVDEYFAVGALREAAQIAEHALDRVIERTDFAKAQRWLGQLEPVRGEANVGLVTADLLLAVAREEYGRGMSLADELAAAGQRDQLCRASNRAAALMGWCYLHAGRLADMAGVLDAAGPGIETDAVRYALSVADDVLAARYPASGTLSGGPLDALVMRTHYERGRLPLLTEQPTSPWAVKATEPWRVSALLATGHVEQAFELHEALQGAQEQSIWLRALLGPALMCELAEPDEAWRRLREGRELIAASGSAMFETFSLLLEAELALRLNEDTPAARGVLDRIAAHPICDSYAFLREHMHALSGLRLLLDHEDHAARQELSAAADSMREGDRILLLPATAVYLAEAEWRIGDENAADAAANLALAAAAEQGSHHLLLQALARFPAVLSRRLDLERTGDSAWHELGRALTLHGIEVGDRFAASVHLTEFGRIEVLVNGVEVQPRLKKSYELLAFVAASGRGGCTRQQLLDALFDGRSDESAASYLRQALLRLRRAVPDLLDGDTAQGPVRFSARSRVSTESERVASLVKQAASLRGEERLRMLLEALVIADRGPYLPAITSAWVEERRQWLSTLAQDARCVAAETAFACNRPGQAERLITEVLKADPYRESAYRLEMRIAAELGDHDRVIAAYRSCERILGELDAQPAPTTVQLLHDLRR